MNFYCCFLLKFCANLPPEIHARICLYGHNQIYVLASKTMHSRTVRILLDFYAVCTVVRISISVQSVQCTDSRFLCSLYTVRILDLCAVRTLYGFSIFVQSNASKSMPWICCTILEIRAHLLFSLLEICAKTLLDFCAQIVFWISLSYWLWNLFKTLSTLLLPLSKNSIPEVNNEMSLPCPSPFLFMATSSSI